MCQSECLGEDFHEILYLGSVKIPNFLKNRHKRYCIIRALFIYSLSKRQVVKIDTEMALCTVQRRVQYSTPSVYRLVFFSFRIKLQHRCHHLSTHQFVSLGRPIIFSFISSSDYYYRSSTNHETTPYSILSSVLSNFAP